MQAGATAGSAHEGQPDHGEQDSRWGAWVDGPEAAVRLRVDGPVATVTLDRPARRNSQLPATWHALARVEELLPAGTRIVVLRGEGLSFSAGLDRSMFAGEGGGLVGMAELPADEVDATIAGYQRGFTWWSARPDVVSIAAVQGHAVGAGFQLALACDLRVLADDAQLAMRETSLGIVPDLAGTGPLVDLVGYPRALEICATGRWVDAAEAERLGLAELVVPRDRLEATVAQVAAALMAAPHGAVTETKALLAGASHRSREEQLAAERAHQARRIADLAAGRP
ncbi:MAG: enoyl-CoA hydratase/isomerase family protein [Motilibacteraceae bacterium]